MHGSGNAHTQSLMMQGALSQNARRGLATGRLGGSSFTRLPWQWTPFQIDSSFHRAILPFLRWLCIVLPWSFACYFLSLLSPRRHLTIKAPLMQNSNKQKTPHSPPPKTLSSSPQASRIYLNVKKQPTSWLSCPTRPSSERNSIWLNVSLRVWQIWTQTPLFKKMQCPGWCGSVDWAPACKPKGYWFNSWSGHMPELPARSLVGGVWEATNWCISCTLMLFCLFLPPLPSLEK